MGAEMCIRDRIGILILWFEFPAPTNVTVDPIPVWLFWIEVVPKPTEFVGSKNTDSLSVVVALIGLSKLKEKLFFNFIIGEPKVCAAPAVPFSPFVNVIFWFKKSNFITFKTSLSIWTNSSTFNTSILFDIVTVVVRPTVSVIGVVKK